MTLAFDLLERAEKVGVVGVDSGTIWIGDPCYLRPEDGEDLRQYQGPFDDWHAFVDKLNKGPFNKSPPGVQFNYKRGHAGLGVVVQSFGGDGTYPVYIVRDLRGQVRMAIIDFAGDLEEPEEWPEDEEGTDE